MFWGGGFFLLIVLFSYDDFLEVKALFFLTSEIMIYL